MKNDFIMFCGKKCKVVRRYTISEEHARENDLYFRNRITFIAPDGNITDCANTFENMEG